jgi:hypothetical protein
MEETSQYETSSPSADFIVHRPSAIVRKSMKESGPSQIEMVKI